MSYGITSIFEYLFIFMCSIYGQVDLVFSYVWANIVLLLSLKLHLSFIPNTIPTFTDIYCWSTSTYVYFCNENSVKQKQHAVDSIWRHRMYAWRKNWLRHCSQLGRRRILTASQFLAAQLLPWWLQCVECGKWRQVSAQSPIGSTDSAFNPVVFSCRNVFKVSSCSIS